MASRRAIMAVLAGDFAYLRIQLVGVMAMAKTARNSGEKFEARSPRWALNLGMVMWVTLGTICYSSPCSPY